MKSYFKITGLQELEENLSYIAQIPAKRIGGRVVMRMAQVLARGIRAQIRPTIAPRIADKGIGYRRLRRQGQDAILAKIGVAVGRAGKNATKFTSKMAAKEFKRGKRPGVGVTAANLHWFALGTKPRYTGEKLTWKNGRRVLAKTGNARRYVGQIDKTKWGGFVQRGFEASQSQAIEAGKVLGERLIAEEIARLDPYKRPVFTVE